MSSPAGHTLHKNPEEALNAIAVSVNDLSNKIDALTFCMHSEMIRNAARVKALSQVLKFSADDVFDLYNAAQKEESKMSEKYEQIVLDTSDINQLLRSILSKT